MSTRLFLLAALLMAVVSPSCNAFNLPVLGQTPVSTRRMSNPTMSSRSTLLQAKNKGDDDDDKKPINKAPPRNLIPTALNGIGGTVGTVVTTAGWLFVIVGFALNFFGMDYVVKDGKVTIGTVEERDFQAQFNLNRVNKRAKMPPIGDSPNNPMMQIQKLDE